MIDSRTLRRFVRTATQTFWSAAKPSSYSTSSGARPCTSASGPSTARRTSATVISPGRAPASSRPPGRAASRRGRRGAGRRGSSPGTSAGWRGAGRGARPCGPVDQGEPHRGAHRVVRLGRDAHRRNPDAHRGGGAGRACQHQARMWFSGRQPGPRGGAVGVRRAAGGGRAVLGRALRGRAWALLAPLSIRSSWAPHRARPFTADVLRGSR